MLNLDTTKMPHTSDEMSIDNPKVDESKVQINMWYRSAWIDQGVVVI